MPCQCGKTVVVEISQAGNEVVCSCGQNLTVPSMLKIKQLEPFGTDADADETIVSSAAVVRRTLFVVGLLLFLPSFYFAALAVLSLSWSPCAAFLSRDPRLNVPGINMKFQFKIYHVDIGLGSMRPPQPIDVLRKQTSYIYQDIVHVQDSTPLTAGERQTLGLPDEYIDYYLSPFDVFLFIKTLGPSPSFGDNFRENYQGLWDAYYIRVTAVFVWLAVSLILIVASFLIPNRTQQVGVRKGTEWRG